MRKSIVSLLVGAGLIVASGVASARPNIDVGISFGFPAPIYVAPPPPVYYPRPVYVAPPPIYYAPAPVYYDPPVYYAPRRYYNGRHYNGRHRDWDRRYYR